MRCSCNGRRSSPTADTVLSRLSSSLMLDSEFRSHNLGCAIAVSKSIMPLLLPIRKISEPLNYGHDTLLNEIACIVNSRIVIKEPLQYYRRIRKQQRSQIKHSSSMSSTNIQLVDHLNRSPELLFEYLKWLHALHPDILFICYYTDKNLHFI